MDQIVIESGDVEVEFPTITTILSIEGDEGIIELYTSRDDVVPQIVAYAVGPRGEMGDITPAMLALRDETKGYASDADEKAAAAHVSESNAAASAGAAASSALAAQTAKNDTQTLKGDVLASKTLIDTAKADTLAARDTAQAAQTAASGSATAAANSADKAKTSETNAKTSEVNAKTSETNSKTSETKAAASQSAAADSAAASATSASNAAASETNAASSKNAAATSATNGANSATAAAASAGAASTSAKNAATSETNAAASKTAADQSKTAAADSATAAANSATAAADSATDAANSASAANASASAAATSESKAAGSANAAAGSATDAANSAASIVPANFMIRANNGSDFANPAQVLTNIGAAPKVHTHAISDIVGLQNALDNVVLPGRLASTSTVTTDWNTAVDNGFYTSTGAANEPGTGYWIGIVANRAGSTHVVQDLFNTPGSATDTMHYRRQRQNGNWGAWFKVTDAQTELDARYAPLSHSQAISTITGLQAALDAKAPLASPALTGTPTAPTAAAGTNSTQIATTAFVTAADNLKAPVASPAFTGPVKATAGNTSITIQQNDTGAMDLEAFLSTNSATKHTLHLNRYGGAVTVNGLVVATATDISNLQTAINTKQANLGFTPIQQGGGTGQGTNKIYIGWATGNKLQLQVDSTNFGAVWPISINGDAATLGGTTLATLNAAIAGKAAAAHTHAISDVSGLQAALDAKQNALGYSPVNRAGDLMSGSLEIRQDPNPTLWLHYPNVKRARWVLDGGGTLIWQDQGGQNHFYVTKDGAVWTQQLGDLNTRIEQRAGDYANDRRNYCVTDSRMAGYTEMLMANGNIFENSAYLITRAYRYDRDQYLFGGRQPQLYIQARGGWFAAFPF